MQTIPLRLDAISGQLDEIELTPSGDFEALAKIVVDADSPAVAQCELALPEALHNFPRGDRFGLFVRVRVAPHKDDCIILGSPGAPSRQSPAISPTVSNAHQRPSTPTPAQPHAMWSLAKGAAAYYPSSPDVLGCDSLVMSTYTPDPEIRNNTGEIKLQAAVPTDSRLAPCRSLLLIFDLFLAEPPVSVNVDLGHVVVHLPVCHPLRAHPSQTLLIDRALSAETTSLTACTAGRRDPEDRSRHTLASIRIECGGARGVEIGKVWVDAATLHAGSPPTDAMGSSSYDPPLEDNRPVRLAASLRNMVTFPLALRPKEVLVAVFRLVLNVDPPAQASGKTGENSNNTLPLEPVVIDPMSHKLRQVWAIANVEYTVMGVPEVLTEPVVLSWTA